MAKISITRALVTIKNMSAKIDSAIKSGTYLDITVGRNQNKKLSSASTLTLAEVGNKIQASYDTVNSLISGRAALKAKIVLSNATTNVTLGGRVMSVAEAIELKASVAHKEGFLLKLRTELHQKQTLVNNHNNALQATIDSLVAATYGSDKTKISDVDVKSITTAQLDQREAALLDNMSIEKQIAELTDEINMIKTELDFVLSESNSKTEIEVS